MSVVSTNIRKDANSVTAMDCGENRNALRLTTAVMRVAQGLWPKKTAAELSLRTGSQVRACEYWIARRTEMSAEALAGLIPSDSGLQVLEAIIGDSKPIWWRDFKRATKRAELRRQQTLLAKALEANEQAELDL